MKQLVELVENPRKRRVTRRRKASRKPARRRRRRNPYVPMVTNRARKRRRNPFGLGRGGVNFKDVAWMSAGAVGVRAMPALVQKVWPAAPVAGVAGKGVQLVGAFLLSRAVKMFAGKKAGDNILAGALVYTIAGFAAEQLLPAVGLSGYVHYPRLSVARRGYPTSVAERTVARPAVPIGVESLL